MDTSRITVNCSILLTDLPLLHRPQAARDAGFDAVEFWWPFATAVPAEVTVSASSRPTSSRNRWRKRLSATTTASVRMRKASAISS